MYRSKLLTTILARLGHSQTYDFGLELETAIAKALTPHIVKGTGNEVFHFEWDNMNKITTNIHGSNVINSTAALSVYKRNTIRALTARAHPPETQATVHIYNRAGPKLPERSTFMPPDQNNGIYLKAKTEYDAWLLTRIIGSNSLKQVIPGFGGFVSATGVKPTRKSTIESLTPIHQPFTEYALITELLRRSKKATREVGQDYILNTFDLGGCMKALPMIWKYPEWYKSIL